MAGTTKSGAELVGELRAAKKSGNVDVLAAVAADENVKPAMRLQAVKAIRKIGDRRAAPALIGLIDDPNPTCRFMAIETLGELGHDGAVEPLMKAAAAPGNKTVLKSAEALGKLEARKAVGVLAGLLEHPDWKIRRTAGLALSRIGTKTAYEALTRQSERELSRAKRKVMARYAEPSEKR